MPSGLTISDQKTKFRNYSLKNFKLQESKLNPSAYTGT